MEEYELDRIEAAINGLIKVIETYVHCSDGVAAITEGHAVIDNVLEGYRER